MLNMKTIASMAVTEIENGHTMADIFDDFREAVVKETLVRTRGNQSKAARLLGINRGTLGKISRGERPGLLCRRPVAGPGYGAKS